MKTPRLLLRLAAFALLTSMRMSAAANSQPDPAVYTREVLDASMKFAEPFWDDRLALLWSPNAVRETTGKVHRVRETGWYALGLFQRRGPGDDARAIRAIEAILAQQIDEPGAAWNGTFFRYPEEPQIPSTAVAWNEYDPNWRQFIGTTLALALIDFADRLPPALRARMLAAIVRAADGEQKHGRLVPGYTNIALMHAFLCAFAGERGARPDLAKVGADYVEAIYAGFKEHETFEEFNSPTYYGVDFYGLALWRQHGLAPRMKTLGAELEAALWRDTADFYHAGLRNLCGPYDRSYGMDMRRYVALAGLWTRMALPEDLAPFPPLGGEMDHVHDFFCAPCYTLLGARIPADALARFQKFSGEKNLVRLLPRNRTATAWLGENAMWGAEAANFSRSVADEKAQYHPATLHWKTSSGTIGWMRLVRAPRADATAKSGGLTIVGTGNFIFRFCAPRLQPENFTRDGWNLPGLTVRVESDARDFSLAPGDGYIDVSYREASRFALRIEEPRPMKMGAVKWR